ncbi:MAG: IS5 family transposase, partial [Calditrichaeota bacterium]|nr:IS5 family transposase [Calditrichota bacterium]
IIYSLKCLFLQYLYNLSDPQLEDALIDRLSFQRFLGISFEEEIPDFTTIWRFRERLAKSGVLDKLFEHILNMLEEKGLILRRGTLIDASIIQSARRPRTKTPDSVDNEGNKGNEENSSAQQDHDADFQKRGNRSYYGYKAHIGVDEGSGIIRKGRFTSASVHDSQEFEKLLCGDEASVFADKAYADRSRKRQLRRQGVYCGILDKAYRNRPLSTRQKKRNHQKSRVRGVVERVFAHFKRHYGFSRVRYVTRARNEVQFKFLCMIYNVRRGLALMPA